MDHSPTSVGTNYTPPMSIPYCKLFLHADRNRAHETEVFLTVKSLVGWGGVGWVGDDNVPCTCTHAWCYATGCFSRTCTHVGCYASDGVGWGGDDHVPCTCTHAWCYATGCFSRTGTHVRCYASDGVGWGGDDNVPCTCTHVWCYATGCFSRTCTHVGCYVIGFPCSRTHVRCYASDGVGWGQVFTYRTKNKQVLFIPTRPPTTYVHTSFCPQHDYWWCLFTTRRFPHIFTWKLIFFRCLGILCSSACRSVTFFLSTHTHTHE